MIAKLFFILLPLLNASDNIDNAIFENLSYPIEATTNSSEKENFVIYETPYSLPPKQDYNSILIQGETQDLNISIEISIKINPQKENTIKPSKFKIYKNGRFWAKFVLTNSTKNPFKLVFRNITSSQSFKITIYEIQAIKIPVKKDEINSSTTTYIPDPSLFIPEDIPFKIIRRKDWEAAPPKEPYIQHFPMAITIHHTAGRYPTTLEESIQEIQFIQDYHQNAKGWIDIGYHFLIDPLGNIFEGRPLKAVGAHVSGKNTNNIGISIMGFYHPPKNNEVSTNTIVAIITLAKYLSENYNIVSSSFYAHRDLGQTDCPGDILYSYMPKLKEMIFTENLNPKILKIDISHFNLEAIPNKETDPINQLLQEFKRTKSNYNKSL